MEEEEDEEAEAEEEEDEGQVQIGAQLHVPGREPDEWNTWLLFTLQGFFRLGGDMIDFTNWGLELETVTRKMLSILRMSC